MAGLIPSSPALAPDRSSRGRSSPALEPMDWRFSARRRSVWLGWGLHKCFRDERRRHYEIKSDHPFQKGQAGLDGS